MSNRSSAPPKKRLPSSEHIAIPQKKRKVAEVDITDVNRYRSRPFHLHRLRSNDRSLYPFYDEWPSSIPRPSVLFALAPPSSSSLPESAALLRHKQFVEGVVLNALKAPTTHRQPVDVQSPRPDPATSESVTESMSDIESFQMRVDTEPSKSVRVRVPAEIAEAFEEQLRSGSTSSSPMVNLVRSWSFILDQFLQTEAAWERWVAKTNQLAEDEWNEASCVVHKVPIVAVDQLERLMTTCGVHHLYRVMLSALLWALHVGCPPIGLPPRARTDPT